MAFQPGTSLMERARMINVPNFGGRRLSKEKFQLNNTRHLQTKTMLLRLLILFSFCLGCSQKHSNQILGSDKSDLDTSAGIYSVEEEDLSMNAAIHEAQKTIDEFDQALKSNNPGYTGFAVKKKYKTLDGGEYMWINEITLFDGKYKGIVNNIAEKTTEVKYGDTVIVRRDEITDWMYVKENILRGGYTIREIRNRLNKDQRTKMDKELGVKIED